LTTATPAPLPALTPSLQQGLSSSLT
jgi:hypothetical protein